MDGPNITPPVFRTVTPSSVELAQGTTEITMGVRSEHLNIVEGDDPTVELTEALG